MIKLARLLSFKGRANNSHVMVALLAVVVSAACGSAPSTASSSASVNISNWALSTPAGSLDLLAVQLTHEGTGWAVGDIDPRGVGGRIYHTADGGRHWRPGSGTTEILTAIHFLDRRTGWIAGYAGRIDRTDDGGQTWRVQRSENRAEVINAIGAADEQIVIAVGARGLILRSRDGGATWSTLDAPRNDLWAVRFASPTHGWIAGDGGLLLLTTDGGARWEPQQSQTDRTLYSLAAISPTTVVAVGDGGTIVRTEDGRAWSRSEVATDKALYAVAAAQPGTVWAAGEGGTIVRSQDAGKSWTVVPSPTTVRVSGLALATPDRGVAVGQKGVTLFLE